MSLNVKLVIGASVIIATVAYVAYLGASSSYRYYVLVDECADDAGRLQGKRVRVSGRVGLDSLVISDDRSLATFTLCGSRSEIIVTCPGPLPDNLAENMDVVVEGKLDEAELRGEKVITRCASKYESQQRQSGESRAKRPIY